MERVLINENSIAAAAALDRAKDTAQLINSKLTPALLAIGVQISDETLQDCLSGGSNTRKGYFEAVRQDTKATRTPSLRKQMEEFADSAYELFEGELALIRKEARNYKFLTVVNGECVLTLANEEKLNDISRIYLTDPKEIEAYNLHVEITDLLNRLFKGRPPYLWASIFLESTGRIYRNDETIYSKLI